MKRRLVILFGTFAVLLLAFLVYYLASERDIPWVQRSNPAARPTLGPPTTIPGLGKVSPVSGGVIYQYDKHHRLRAKYTFRQSKRVGEKFYLTEPKVEWYLRGGETAVLTAAEGIVTAEDVAGRWKIRNGELRDPKHVKIVIDRSTDPDRPPLEKDMVRIYVDDDVHFDNDLRTIQSDGRVKVFSREADIFGAGLWIAWSDRTRQLRELRIVHGDRMVIREGQDRFLGEMTLPGGAGPAVSSDLEPPVVSRRQVEPPVVSRVETPVVSRVEPPVVSPSTSLRSTLLATSGTSDVEPPVVTSAPTTFASTSPSTQPITPTSIPTSKPVELLPVVPDTYVATFSDDVLVTSGARSLKGADELRLVFEFTPPQEDRRPSTGETDRRSRPAPPVDKTSSPGPGDQAAAVTSAPAPKADGPSATTTSAETQPAEQPLIVTWTGPLVVRPLRSRQKPVPKRFDVMARGKRLELSDSKAKAVCKRFEFRSPEQEGELLGLPDEPVKLQMAKGEKISAQRVRFNRRTGVVNLDGAGSMYMPDATSVGPTAAERDDKEKQELTIKWTKNVVASLGQRRIETDEGTKSEEYIRTATFVGDVDVRQGKTRRMQAEELTVRFHEPIAASDPANHIASLHATGSVEMTDTESGDFVKSQTLDVQMAPPSEEETYPREVVAEGDVSARQEQNEITAKKMLTITFSPVRNEKTGKIEIKPHLLDASGAVKIIDHSGSKPAVVEGETVTSDLLARTAGVVGPGRLRFYTDTDISGNKTDRPRPVNIAWTKRMNYSDKERTAIIDGGVRFKTADDELDCENMHVLFAPPKEKAKPEPTSRPTTRATEFERFRSQKIAMVVARKKVRLKSLRKDKDGFWLQRVQLRSEHAMYEAEEGTLSCDGPGTLIAEDYRPPEKKAAGDRRGDALTAGVSSPSQSVFEWSKSMRMDQANRTVRMSGDVRMVHCSGSQMVLTKKLNVRPWGKLPAGRKTIMTCSRMLARFDPPDEDPRPSGPRVGRLILFDATDDVNLKDGPRQIFCQRILYLYRRPTDKKIIDRAIIWGSLPGRPVKDAIMYYQDDKRSVLQSWKSPRLIWHRSNNRVEAKGVESHGGR